MPDVNPYQPSAETPVDNAVHGGTPKRVYFFGGFMSLLVVGVIAGLGSAWLIANVENQFALYGPVVVWFLALVTTHALLRGSPSSLLRKAGLSLALTPLACVLYFPVCFFSGLASVQVFGSQGYGPNATGLAISSVIAFASALFVIALIVRAFGRAQAKKLENTLRIEQSGFTDSAFAMPPGVATAAPETPPEQQSSGAGNQPDE